MSSGWPPEEDRPDGDGRVEPLPIPLVIPDDARELERDRIAWLREQRAARRRARWAHLTGGGRGGAGDATTTRVLVGIVALAGLASTMLFLLGHWSAQRSPAALGPRPLATSGTEPGTVGGLLPDARARLGGGSVPVRALRPAVFALVPASCTCDRAVSDLVAQAGEYHLPVYLVDSRDPARLNRLAARAGHGRARALLDPEGVLARRFAPRGLTAVLVHSNGIIAAVVPGVTPGARLEPRLRPLVGPGPRPAPDLGSPRGSAAATPPTAGLATPVG